MIVRPNILQRMRMRGIMKVQVRVDRSAVRVRVRMNSLSLAKYKIESSRSKQDDHERNSQLKEGRDAFRNFDPENNHQYTHNQNRKRVPQAPKHSDQGRP